jgi:hypothetical protein
MGGTGFTPWQPSHPVNEITDSSLLREFTRFAFSFISILWQKCRPQVVDGVKRRRVLPDFVMP